MFASIIFRIFFYRVYAGLRNRGITCRRALRGLTAIGFEGLSQGFGIGFRV